MGASIQYQLSHGETLEESCWHHDQVLRDEKGDPFVICFVDDCTVSTPRYEGESFDDTFERHLTQVDFP